MDKDYYKKILAKKENYYNSLESMLKISDNEEEVILFFYIFERMYSAALSGETEFCFDNYNIPAKGKQRLSLEFELIKGLKGQVPESEYKEVLTKCLDYIRTVLFFECFLRPLSSYTWTIFTRPRKSLIKTEDLSGIYDAVNEADHEVDVLILEEMLSDLAGVKKRAFFKVAKLWLKLTKKMAEVYKVETLILKNIKSGKYASMAEFVIDTSLSIDLGKFAKPCYTYMLEEFFEKHLIYGMEITPKEFTIIQSLLDNEYLYFVRDWLMNDKAIKYAHDYLEIESLYSDVTEYPQESGSTFADQNHIFVKVCQDHPGYSLNRPKLISWIESEFLPTATSEWDWFGLVYILNHYKCFKTYKASMFADSIYSWYGKDVNPSIPKKLSAASTMFCCHILDNKTHQLINKSETTWNDFRDNYCKKDFGTSAAKIAYNSIVRLTNKFNINDFLDR